MNRVGRFGDLCSRTCFADVPLINKVASIKARGALGMVLAKMSKAQVALKTVAVKKISLKPPSKTYPGKNPKRV